MNDDIKEIFNLLSKELTFVEAQKYFKNKIPLTKKEFDELKAICKTNAFTVSNYTNLNVIKEFQDEILKAIENGTTLNEFRKNINLILIENDYKAISRERAENIFRTNIQTAYNVGHYKQMTDKAVIKHRPYWQYEAVDDSHTRPQHQAMNGKVFPADSEVWDTWYPPNGYKCRCTVTALSKQQVESEGLTIEDDLPDHLVPDEGFHTNPAKVSFKPDLKDYPDSLKKAYENVMKGGE